MKLQNAAAPLIIRKKKRESVKESLKDLHWLNIDQRLFYKILLLVFKCLHNLAPSSFIKTLSVKTVNTLILQTNYFPKTNLGKIAFSFYAPDRIAYQSHFAALMTLSPTNLNLRHIFSVTSQTSV